MQRCYNNSLKKNLKIFKTKKLVILVKYFVIWYNIGLFYIFMVNFIIGSCFVQLGLAKIFSAGDQYYIWGGGCINTWTSKNGRKICPNNWEA